MSAVQPGAASTTHAQRPRRTARPRRPAIKPAPQYDEQHHGSKLFWVFCAIESAINAEILWQMATSPSTRRKAQSTAMLAGYSQLCRAERECVKYAHEAGQLLICWQGTKVLEVPA